MNPRPAPTSARVASTAAVPTQSMQRRVYELLRAMIGDGRIGPGARLLEAQVAKAFGVSRSPARHALRALAAERVLRRGDGRGYIVGGASGGGATGAVATLEVVALSPVPRWERIYAEVEQALCTHALFHRVRITEERLAGHFGVSRTVARDVLARMDSVGLLAKDRHGRWVADRFTAARIRNLYEIRWLLEPQALLLAAPRVPRERLVAARDAVRRTLAQLSDDSASALDRIEHDLHLDVLGYCPNPELLRSLARSHLLLLSNRYMFDLYLGVPRRSVGAALRGHRRVLDLLLRGDRERAADALAAHLRTSCGHWLQRFAAIAAMNQPALPPYLAAVDNGPNAAAPVAAPAAR